MKRWMYCLIMAITTVLNTGCEYKELDEDIIRETFPVTVDFAWTKVDSIPKSYRLVVYPADKSTYINKERRATFDVYNTKHTIYLPTGRYNMVAWNNDGEHTVIAGYDEQKTLYATTQILSENEQEMPDIIDTLQVNKTIRDAADYLTNDVVENFEVIETTDGDENRVIVTPDSMNIRVDVCVNGIGGLTFVKQVRGIIGDIAAKGSLARQEIEADTCAVMFDFAWKERDSLLFATFHIFGKYDNLHRVKDFSKEKAQMMYLFFWLDNGNVFLPINISRYLAQRKEEEKHIVIEIPSMGIDIRNFIASDSGFFISVDDWTDEEHIDIGL